MEGKRYVVVIWSTNVRPTDSRSEIGVLNPVGEHGKFGVNGVDMSSLSL